MSLLLDALNRAGKLKSAADAPESTKGETDWPALGLLPQEAEQAVPAQAAADTHSIAETPSTADTPSIAAPSDLEDVTRPDVELALAPTANASVEMTAPVPSVKAVREPARSPEPQSEKAAPAPQSEKLAQTMLRAKARPASSSSRRPRLLALGGLAGFLGLGLISIVMGWFDPLALLSPSTSTGGVNQIAAVTAVPTAAVPAPIPTAAQAPVATDPVTQPASATPPPTGSRTAPAVNRIAGKSNSEGKAGSAVQSPAPKTMTVAPDGAGSSKSSTQAVDCPTGSTAADCRIPAKQVAKARAKVLPPKPPEPQPSIVAKAVGPNHLEVAYAALTQGRTAEAAAAYKAALTENPEERDALLGLAYIAHQGAREEEARDLYQRVLRQEPNNPSARAGLLIQTLSNDAEDVSVISRDVAEQNPGSAAAQSVLGHSLVRQGRLADAQQAFQRAHALEPGVALHAFNLAVALDRLRSYGQARTYYERALALSRQIGGEASSGISHAVVSNRLQELLSAKATEAPASR
jgi:tetratricopeptide (TPR) repeat protein